MRNSNQSKGAGSLTPTGSDQLHASRVAVGLIGPGIVLLIAERPDLIIFAVFGSFIGMYGRTEPHHLRVIHQVQAGTVLLVGVGTGVLLSSIHAAPWVLVTVEAVFAWAGSLLTDRLNVRPRGPFYGIFAVGAIATIPARQAAPWVALSIYAVTALFCITISSVGALLSSSDQSAIARPLAEANRSQLPDSGIHAARYALAITLAGSGGLALGVDHANWAMAAAAVPLAAENARSAGALSFPGVMQRGTQRLIGTLAGLVISAILLLPQFSTTVLAIAAIALLFPTELYMARHYALAVGFFTPLIILVTELSNPAGAVTFLGDRAIDNVIGVSAGIAVSLAMPGRRPKWRRRSAA
ncbi:FUSC family protein [Mycolicibacter icosiumassiliensis]|uniref:FUSC family protein n=1 Tax=Mycolicibacter icosiumassiliensis TaxID=1792835 RepID=UPI000831655F|nr:FUSC family protein [Mycolicibacter icosiumassiliensis]